MIKKKYRWDSPHSWLHDKMQDMEAGELFNLAVVLSYELDEDKIQDMFQPLMNKDGYFEEIKEKT